VWCSAVISCLDIIAMTTIGQYPDILGARRKPAILTVMSVMIPKKPRIKTFSNLDFSIAINFARNEDG
jgi:hypothetical protein